MVRIAETQIIQKLVEPDEDKPPWKIRRRTAKAAALGPTERTQSPAQALPGNIRRPDMKRGDRKLERQAHEHQEKGNARQRVHCAGWASRALNSTG